MRKQSNSITHLVKIVAEEVYDDKTSRLREHIIDVESRLDALKSREGEIINAEEFIKRVQSSTEKAGQIWSKDEDALLVKEVKMAIKQIAFNHRRTVGAIIARVEHRGVVNCQTLDF